jgi:two-component system CheB/CheR fusion protein
VIEVGDRTRLDPNRVYVIPAGSRATLFDGEFRLVARPKGSRREMPIDLFFESLADNFKHSGIGVILSGTLSDGALGLKAIKAEGGVTFVQNEASARFPAMPRAALAVGPADFVLPPRDIARELARLGRHIGKIPPILGAPTRKAPVEKEQPASGPEGVQLARIFQILLKATGVDFSNYRPTTIRRRIGRRMLVNRVEALEQYQRCERSTKTSSSRSRVSSAIRRATRR